MMRNIWLCHKAVSFPRAEECDVDVPAGKQCSVVEVLCRCGPILAFGNGIGNLVRFSRLLKTEQCRNIVVTINRNFISLLF